MNLKILAIVVVFALVMFAIVNTLKTRMYRKMVSYLENGQFAEFNQRIDSKFLKFLFPRLSLLDLKLNGALIQQKKKQAIQYLEEICSMPLTASQKDTYYMKAFNFFVGINDHKNCKKYITLINESQNDRMKVEANRVYNIYILKNDHDLQDLLDELEYMEDYQKGVNEFLISLIYKNKKDRVNAKKYEELSRQHFAIVDEQTANKYKG